MLVWAWSILYEQISFGVAVYQQVYSNSNTHVKTAKPKDIGKQGPQINPMN